MYATIITALLAAFASLATIAFTKQKEREAAWKNKKLSYYEEFFGAASGIVAEGAPPSAQMRFATAVNNLHLIGSAGVINALHRFSDEISASNRPNFSIERHDLLWSRLVWEIRVDLDDPPCRRPQDFQARLWNSGMNCRSD